MLTAAITINYNYDRQLDITGDKSGPLTGPACSPSVSRVAVFHIVLKDLFGSRGVKDKRLPIGCSRLFFWPVAHSVTLFLPPSSPRARTRLTWNSPNPTTWTRSSTSTVRLVLVSPDCVIFDLVKLRKHGVGGVTGF